MQATIGALLREAGNRLAGLSDTPHLDAEVLLAQVLQKPRSHLHAWPERAPEQPRVQRFAALIERRLAGWPVAYLIGSREFWSLDLAVTPATLIPRPETERLVELVLNLTTPRDSFAVADMGTGSGAIALAIARERPLARVVATEFSSEALAVAKANARRLGAKNVEFRQGDWCQALNGERFDLIVCNPPYLAAADPHLRRGDLRFEPRSALVSGADGLDAIRGIVAQSMAHLPPGGRLLLEHGYDQSGRVRALLRAHGYTEVIGYRDAAGVLRVAGGCRRR